MSEPGKQLKNRELYAEGQCDHDNSRRSFTHSSTDNLDGRIGDESKAYSCSNG